MKQLDTSSRTLTTQLKKSLDSSSPCHRYLAILQQDIRQLSSKIICEPPSTLSEGLRRIPTS